MRPFRRSLVLTGIAVLPLCILTFGSPAWAQERATDVGPRTLVTPLAPNPLPSYGTTSTAVLTVSAWAFQSFDGSVQNATGPYDRYSPTGQEVEASFFLPAGAVITSIQMEGCDTSATDEVVFILWRGNANGSFTTLSPLGSTGAAETPGCGVFNLALNSPETVDNSFTYTISLRGGTTNATTYTAVRVMYHLQVSPAPGTATFSDVPTSYWAFQYIEALAASGITVGCTPGTFCPEDPVTRAQMAVFLAKALGLHFPN